MITTAPANSTTKIMNWDKLTGGKVVMLLPFTTVGESSLDDGILDSTKPPYYPTQDSLNRLEAEDHIPLSIIPMNIDYFYNQTNLYASQNDITVNFKSIPKGFSYSDYLQQVLQACNGKQTGAFDVLWLDATAAGILGECLSDLWQWNSDIVANQDQHLVANNIYKNRLGNLITLSM